MGTLRWSPKQFWGSTMHDLVAALEGYQIAKGDTRWADQDKEKELRAGLEKLKAKQKAMRGE